MSVYGFFVALPFVCVFSRPFSQDSLFFVRLVILCFDMTDGFPAVNLVSSIVSAMDNSLDCFIRKSPVMADNNNSALQVSDKTSSKDFHGLLAPSVEVGQSKNGGRGRKRSSNKRNQKPPASCCSEATFSPPMTSNLVGGPGTSLQGNLQPVTVHVPGTAPSAEVLEPSIVPNTAPSAEVIELSHVTSRAPSVEVSEPKRPSIALSTQSIAAPAVAYGVNPPPPEMVQMWHQFMAAHCNSRGPIKSTPSAALGKPPGATVHDGTSDCSLDFDGASVTSLPHHNLSECMQGLIEDISDASEDDDDVGGAQNTSDILQDISSSFETAACTGQNIDSKLANLANTGFRSIMSKENVKTLCDKYPRPGNCDRMSVPRINSEIFGNLRGHGDAQANDTTIQKAQQMLLCASVPMFQLMEMIMKHKRNQPFLAQDALRLAGDNFKLLSASFGALTLHRREMIKPFLQGRFKKICNPNNPVTDNLFGDDLSQKVKEITDAGKLDVVRHYTASHGDYRSRNYRKPQPYPKRHAMNAAPGTFRRNNIQFPAAKGAFLGAKPFHRHMKEGRGRRK